MFHGVLDRPKKDQAAGDVNLATLWMAVLNGTASWFSPWATQGRCLLWIAFADSIDSSFMPAANISAHPFSVAEDSFLSDCVTFDGYSSYINVKDSSVFTGWMM